MLKCFERLPYRKKLEHLPYGQDLLSGPKNQDHPYGGHFCKTFLIENKILRPTHFRSISELDAFLIVVLCALTIVHSLGFDYLLRFFCVGLCTDRFGSIRSWPSSN